MNNSNIKECSKVRLFTALSAIAIIILVVGYIVIPKKELNVVQYCGSNQRNEFEIEDSSVIGKAREIDYHFGKARLSGWCFFPTSAGITDIIVRRYKGEKLVSVDVYTLEVNEMLAITKYKVETGETITENVKVSPAFILNIG